MIEVRSAAIEDKAAFRELWKLCFHDSEEFIDWFFQERFYPEFSSCLLEDNVIMSALQSYPLHVRIRGKILSASMLAGVSTHPKRNGRGYMRQIFSHYMQRVRDFGIPIAIHTPAHLPTFFSRGHFPATNTLHLDIPAAKAASLPDGVYRHPLTGPLALLQQCYQRVTEKYAGCVSRTMGDFAFKMRDYAADGAQCLIYKKGEDVMGYCVYYVLPDNVHAEECFADDKKALSLLLKALCHEANGRNLHVKLPPDSQVEMPDAKIEIRPQGVMGVANISRLLPTLMSDESYVFEVMDEVVTQNSGVWDGMGRQTARNPHISISVGRLGQFLNGYRSMAELVQEGEAKAMDSKAISRLDEQFPKQVCFITDEY